MKPRFIPVFGLLLILFTTGIVSAETVWLDESNLEAQSKTGANRKNKAVGG